MVENRLLAVQDAINQMSSQFKIDHILLSALVLQESGGDSWASRFERLTWQKRERFVNPSFYAEKLHISQDTEEVFQCTSWGPMQLMGFVAREVGYDGQLNRLSIPEVGLSWSAKKLDRILAKYMETPDVIAAWNHGHAEKLPNGEYSNQKYVDSVLLYMELITKGD